LDKSQKRAMQQLNSVNVLVPTFDSARWNSKVLIAVDSFLKTINCPDCIYEIYIDKILPDYTLITLKSRNYAYGYMASLNPLYITKLYGRNFYVYTGLEDVLKGDKKHMIVYKDSSSITFVKWTLVIKGDSLRIEKKDNYPFFPSEELSPYFPHKKT
jgi:hypothetical protein